MVRFERLLWLRRLSGTVLAALGFLLKNQESSRPLKEFAVTVDAVEKLTGLDFFSALPQKEQENLESTVIVGDWSWIK